MTTERKLPQDADAKERFLAYVGAEPIGRDVLLAALTPEDFDTDTPRARLFEAWQAVAAEHTALGADELLVRDWLRQHDPKSAESLGAFEHIRGTVTTNLAPDPGGTVALELAGIIRRLRQARAGIEVVSAAAADLYDRMCSPADTCMAVGLSLTHLAADWTSASPSINSHNSAFPTSRTWPEAPHQAAYSGLAGDIVRMLEPQTESDPAALLAQLLVYFAAHIGRVPHWTHEETRHALNLYTVLVGPTGRGRKGTSRDRVQGIFGAFDAHWADTHVLNGLSSGEGLIAAVRDQADVATSIKDALVVESEFGGPLEHMSREGNILSVVLRQLWDGDSVRTLTRHDPMTAKDVYLSLIGHITEDDLLKHMTSQLAGDGLGNRVLWIASRRARLLPFGGDAHPSGMESLVRHLKDAVTFARDMSCIGLSEPTRRLWERVYPALTRERLGLYGKLTSRAEAQTRRLACHYALLDRTNLIRPEHLRAALALWDYSERTVAYVFGEAVGDKVADQLLGAIRAEPFPGPLTTDLYDVVGHHVKAAMLHDKLAVLVHHGLVQSFKEAANGNGHKPSERWRPMTGTTWESGNAEFMEVMG
jgi:hypothetical protein